MMCRFTKTLISIKEKRLSIDASQYIADVGCVGVSSILHNLENRIRFCDFAGLIEWVHWLNDLVSFLGNREVIVNRNAFEVEVWEGVDKAGEKNRVARLIKVYH